MPKFEVDADVAALVEKLAHRQPFENLTFNEALRRVLGEIDESALQVPTATVRVHADRQLKTPSPDAEVWADSVPELRNTPGLQNWKDICRHLRVDTGTDSARRILAKWVSAHHPDWPPVPEPK